MEQLTHATERNGQFAPFFPAVWFVLVFAHILLFTAVLGRLAARVGSCGGSLAPTCGFIRLFRLSEARGQIGEGEQTSGWNPERRDVSLYRAAF